MNLRNPKVSVVMPVYNGGEYFSIALESAINQDYKNIEIVVVNDGSRDDGATEQIALKAVEKYPDRVIYISQENTGVGGALNRGIEAMTGDIFCWLSHDDIFLPHKTRRQVEYWNRLNDQKAMLISDYALIDNHGHRYVDVKFDHASFVNAPMLPLYRGAVNGCTVFIPKCVIQNVEGPFKKELKFTQDFELWHRLIKEYEFFHVPEILVHYRVHPEQDSHNPRAAQESDPLWIRMIEETTPTLRAMLYGSSWRFYDETSKILDASPNKRAADLCKIKRDRCIPETKVSIIIPFYNEIELAARAIQSALAQTHRNIELIIVDDGSTEKYEQINCIRESDDRVKLLVKANGGPASARNLGLTYASGEYVAFLDADDVWLPIKIERQLTEMSHKGAIFSHTSYLVETSDKKLGFVNSGTFNGRVYPSIICNCPIAAPTVMLHASLINQGNRFPESRRIAEDVVFWIELAMINDLHAMSEPLTIVEWSENSAALSTEKSIIGLNNIFEYVCDEPTHAAQSTHVKALSDASIRLAREISEQGNEKIIQRNLSSALSTASRDLARQFLFVQSTKLASVIDVNALLTLYDTIEKLGFDDHISIEIAARCIERRQFTEASKWITNCLAQCTNLEANFSARYLKSLLLSLSGELDRARLCFGELLEERPSNDSVRYALASILTFQGDLDNARAVLDRELMIRTGASRHTSTTCIDFGLPASESAEKASELLKRVVYLPAVDSSSPKETAPELLYLMACDGVYLRKFLKAVISSIEKNGGMDITIHIHLINPSQQDLDFAAATRASCVTDVIISYETVQIDHYSQEEKKVYYSCARYLALPQIICRSECPVLVCDIDQLLLKSLRPIVRGIENAAGGLLVFEENVCNLLSLVSASVMLIAPTSAGRSFCDDLANYISGRIISEIGLCWHLDQAALGICYSRHRDVLAKLDRRIMRSDAGQPDQNEPGDETFWSVTYSIPESEAKLSSPIFDQYS